MKKPVDTNQVHSLSITGTDFIQVLPVLAANQVLHTHSPSFKPSTPHTLPFLQTKYSTHTPLPSNKVLHTHSPSFKPSTPHTLPFLQTKYSRPFLSNSYSLSQIHLSLIKVIHLPFPQKQVIQTLPSNRRK